jgi:hypothetical protein
MIADFQLLDVLAHHGVPFVVIGGHAVNFHGWVRATEDIDVVWLRSPLTETKLFAALQEMDAHYIGDELDPATGIERTYPVTASFVRARSLMMLCTKYGFLDLFDFVPEHPQVPVTQLFESSVQCGDWRFVSLYWLRRMKQAAGRPIDQLDLAHLPLPPDPQADLDLQA